MARSRWGGTSPKPPQRFHSRVSALGDKVKQSGAQVHAVYEACGFGFMLQRQTHRSRHCLLHWSAPEKLDERNSS